MVRHVHVCRPVYEASLRQSNHQQWPEPIWAHYAGLTNYRPYYTRLRACPRMSNCSYSELNGWVSVDHDQISSTSNSIGQKFELKAELCLLDENNSTNITLSYKLTRYRFHCEWLGM